MLPISPSPSSWMNPSLSMWSAASSLLSGNARDLHVRLTPTMMDDETAFLVPLLQEAATKWQGPLRLHLQPHPIPWIFTIPPDQDHQGSSSTTDEDERNDHASPRTATPTFNLSPVLLKELLHLLQCLAVQKRPLTILLARHFIPDSTQLNRILQAAAPSLVRMETNHCHILKWLCQAHQLQTLVMELDHGHDMRRQQLQGLMTLLRDSSFSHLQALHLHMPSSAAPLTTTSNRWEDGELLPLLSSLSICMARKPSLRSIKLSGDLKSILFIVQGWEDHPPGLDQLDIESSETRIEIVATISTEEEIKIASAAHDKIQVPWTAVRSLWKAISTIPKVRLSLRQLSQPSLLLSFSDILRDVLPAPRMTHLTLQAGLTTTQVDHLMTYLGRLTPNIRELDLEGNDVESLELTCFFSSLRNSCATAMTGGPPLLELSYLERIYMGWNLFPYMVHMESIEKLLEACPRLDVGQRAMTPCCGIFSSSEDVSLSDANGHIKKRHDTAAELKLFTSWANSPRTLAWKDWNQHGRYMILFKHTSHDDSCDAGRDGSPSGLWPRVLEHVTRKFHDRPQRQATLLYQFVRSSAIISLS